MRVGELCAIVEEAEVDPSWIGDHGAKSMAALAIGAICDHRGIEVHIHLPSRPGQPCLDHGHYGVGQRTDLIGVLRQESIEWRNLNVSHLRIDANATSQQADTASAVSRSGARGCYAISPRYDAAMPQALSVTCPVCGANIPRPPGGSAMVACLHIT